MTFRADQRIFRSLSDSIASLAVFHLFSTVLFLTTLQSSSITAAVTEGFVVRKVSKLRFWICSNWQRFLRQLRFFEVRPNLLRKMRTTWPTTPQPEQKMKIGQSFPNVGQSLSDVDHSLSDVNHSLSDVNH